jgi:hypothetical protein
MNDDFELIFKYTRADAIRDGLLVDVSTVAKEAGINLPVAATAAVFHNYIRVPAGVTAQDEAGRLWDLVWMMRFAVTRHPETAGDTLLFTLFVRNDDTGPKPVKLKAIVHPGDSGEAVITVLTPDEDYCVPGG